MESLFALSIWSQAHCIHQLASSLQLYSFSAAVPVTGCCQFCEYGVEWSKICRSLSEVKYGVCTNRDCFSASLLPNTADAQWWISTNRFEYLTGTCEAQTHIDRIIIVHPWLVIGAQLAGCGRNLCIDEENSKMSWATWKYLKSCVLISYKWTLVLFESCSSLLQITIESLFDCWIKFVLIWSKGEGRFTQVIRRLVV